MPSATLDGYINLSANTNDQVFALFEEIGRPELKTDPRFSSVAARFQNRLVLIIWTVITTRECGGYRR